MAHAVRYHEYGGPEVLKYESVDVGEPSPGQVRIRQTAIGVNFQDLAMRQGAHATPLPYCPGSEAAGVIEAIGEGVAGFNLGDRVAYGVGGPGGYATDRLIAADIVVKLPDAISNQTAAGMMSAGLTAAYLVRRIWPLQAGDTVLLHAAAGGVGQIFTQWATALGIKVIGVVGSEAKVATAKAAGCEHVVLSSDANFSATVRQLTGGEGVAVAYDCVGKDTFMESMKCVRKRGLLVSFGSASGPPPPIEAMDLVMNGSLYLTRSGVGHYVENAEERQSLTRELVDHVAAGTIRIAVDHSYPLADAAQAHRDIAARKTTGSVVLLT